MKHDRQYHAGRPTIPDAEYDRLYSKLQAMEGSAAPPDSPTRTVGERPVRGRRKVRHMVPMLSLESARDFDIVRAFGRSIDSRTDEAEYIIEPKIDGVSVMLRYEDGLLVTASTRGDGRTGSDITANVLRIDSVPRALIGAPRIVEVRGEVFMSKDSFSTYNAARVGRGLKPHRDSRSVTSGMLRMRDPSGVHGLAFIAHGFGEIVGAEFGTNLEIMDAFKSWGVPVSPYTIVCGDIDEVVDALTVWRVRRLELPYDCDGMVVRVNDLRQRELIGATQRSPNWSIAFKG